MLFAIVTGLLIIVISFMNGVAYNEKRHLERLQKINLAIEPKFTELRGLVESAQKKNEASEDLSEELTKATMLEGYIRGRLDVIGELLNVKK